MSEQKRKKMPVKVKMPVEKKTCYTPVARTSFPHLWEKQGPDGSKPCFSWTGLISTKVCGKSKEQQREFFKDMRRAAINAGIEVWGKDRTTWPKRKDGQPMIDSLFKDGNDKADLDGYKNTVVVKATAKKRRPTVLDRVKDEDTGKYRVVTEREEGEALVYAGCYSRAQIRAYAFDHAAGGKGISFDLIGVQFVRDGEPFGGGGEADFGEAPELEVSDTDEEGEETEEESGEESEEDDAA